MQMFWWLVTWISLIALFPLTILFLRLLALAAEETSAMDYTPCPKPPDFRGLGLSRSEIRSALREIDARDRKRRKTCRRYR